MTYIRNTPIDLKGRKFGKLLALYFIPSNKNKLKYRMWVCKCECGEERIVRTSYLLNGSISMCLSCYSKETNNSRVYDFSGKEFPTYKVISIDNTYYVKNKRKWLCQCQCGNFFSMKTTEILTGNREKCQICIKEDLNKRSPYYNLEGKIYGNFKFIKFIKRYKDFRIWLCQCLFCKNTKEYRDKDIVRRTPYSCGCIKKPPEYTLDKHWNFKGYNEITFEKFKSIKYSAEKRNINFNLTIENIWDQYITQNKTCYYTGLPISFISNTASVDRIDSDKGYTIDNIVLCTTEINKMKSDYSINAFYRMCELVSNNKKTTKYKKFIFVEDNIKFKNIKKFLDIIIAKNTCDLNILYLNKTLLEKYLKINHVDYTIYVVAKKSSFTDLKKSLLITTIKKAIRNSDEVIVIKNKVSNNVELLNIIENLANTYFGGLLYIKV